MSNGKLKTELCKKTRNKKLYLSKDALTLIVFTMLAECAKTLI